MATKPIRSSLNTTSRKTKGGVLRRYTDLPSLLHIIEFKQLTLLSPSNWDDKNDHNFMTAYAERKSLKTCLALCFCERSDRYHYWRVFSPHPAGVCVEFWKHLLIAAADGQGIYHGSMDYLTVRQLQAVKAEERDPDELPFIKRSAFKDEREYRFIYGSKEEIQQAKPFHIDFGMISRIIINPWLRKPLHQAIARTVAKLTKEAIKVEQSRLTDHEVWREYALLCAI